MGNESEEFLDYYECPDCFLTFVIKESEPSQSCLNTHKKCSFCEDIALSDRELLMRRIDVLEHAAVRRFPILIKQLINHVRLK